VVRIEVEADLIGLVKPGLLAETDSGYFESAHTALNKLRADSDGGFKRDAIFDRFFAVIQVAPVRQGGTAAPGYTSRSWFCSSIVRTNPPSNFTIRSLW